MLDVSYYYVIGSISKFWFTQVYLFILKEGLINKSAVETFMISFHEQKRFKEFRKKKKESYLSYKDKICIIIYGAYNPPATNTHLGEKERLQMLKNHLEQDGYSRTFLVDDFEGDNALDKSLDSLDYADLNIFIFTCRGKTGSVARELAEAIKRKILWKCLVYEEVYKKTYKEITAMETLLKEELKENRYFPVGVTREDDEELYGIVSSEVFQFLRRYVDRLAMC